MGDPKKPDRDAIAALLEFSVDYEQTVEEAEQELRAAGVDVASFLARMRERQKRHEEEGRLAWLTTERAKLARRATEPRVVPAKYKAMRNDELIATLRQRQSTPGLAQAFFHKLDKITDDDLRTLLMDLDDLDDEEDPK
jgi:hypothetical protein